MKYLKKILFLVMCMCPIVVFALSVEKEFVQSEIFLFLFLLLIFTPIIHVSVIKSLAKIISPVDKIKITEIILNTIRMIIILYKYITIKEPSFIFEELILIFPSIYILLPISSIVYTKKIKKLIEKNKELNNLTTETIMRPKNFDPIYMYDDKRFIQEFITRKLKIYGLYDEKKLIPQAIVNRKKVFNIILSILTFAYISLLFFHFNLKYYGIGFIILIILFKKSRKYNISKYCIKEIKSRPQEKISNVMMSIKNNFVEDDSGKVLKIGLIISIVLPMIIFIRPKVFYEELDEGYSIRFYTSAIIQDKTVTIPSTYKNKPVISIRGNVFANLLRVNEIILPDTITEIRGQAFINNLKLKNVKLPNSLKTLGGGAFKNCISLESISFPDTVTEIGGEAFFGATSLKEVKLPNNLKEIRGNTFENCSSLTSIKIPDSVTRIAAHAFRKNTSLEYVEISKNSQLKEIGSSAFRECYNLTNISIPKDTSVNEKAFKNSPTTINYYN